ncbi:MAG TPA: twin-arginine translocase TatA/TatE family subunit [Streptosporangiaceae bacterium]|nr:twin-arginine translocase TatA/TatE family subunit [Streptosporangiaceae bacterium]
MFDPSAPHIIILLVVVLLLFGSTRLPGAADALGKAMHIFRKSVKGETTGTSDGSQITPPTYGQSGQISGQNAPQSQQAQIDALQRQLNELQRQTAGSDGVQNGPGESQQSQNWL